MNPDDYCPGDLPCIHEQSIFLWFLIVKIVSERVSGRVEGDSHASNPNDKFHFIIFCSVDG